MLKIENLIITPDVVLAPMAGITDLPFRVICKHFGCGLVYSEMISTKALKYQDKKTFEMLKSCEDEKPLAVQIFGSDPLIMAEGAKKIEDLGIAALIDINMGCPAPKVVNNSDGCALMKNLKLSSQIIESVVKSVSLPVTVKFRKGWDANFINAVEFAKIAQDSGASCVTVHGRTRSQYYSGKADWDIIREIKSVLNIPVIGNGDVFTYNDINKMKEYTKCDGVMIARGALGNPFIFSGDRPENQAIINTALDHLKRIIDYKGEYIGIREARKHMSWYVKGMHGAAKAKDAINSSETYDQMKNVLLNLI